VELLLALAVVAELILADLAVALTPKLLILSDGEECLVVIILLQEQFPPTAHTRQHEANGGFAFALPQRSQSGAVNSVDPLGTAHIPHITTLDSFLKVQIVQHHESSRPFFIGNNSVQHISHTVVVLLFSKVHTGQELSSVTNCEWHHPGIKF
jgi:hypothetical protein